MFLAGMSATGWRNIILFGLRGIKSCTLQGLVAGALYAGFKGLAKGLAR